METYNKEGQEAFPPDQQWGRDNRWGGRDNRWGGGNKLLNNVRLIVHGGEVCVSIKQ